MPIFDSRFLKFLFRISGGINCWDPVEDSDTGGLSSITVRMDTYVLFSNDIVNFAYETDEAESIVLSIFVLWRCLNLWWMKDVGVRLQVLFRDS